jgi:hypothetical protein
MKTTITMGLSVVIVCLTLSAQKTQPARGSDLADRFRQLDRNRDGKLTQEEFILPRMLDLLDQNRDGVVTLDEMRAGARDPSTLRSPTRAKGEDPSLVKIAAASLEATPPKDNPHRRTSATRWPGNEFVQGYPGDDIEFTAVYPLAVVTGELGGFDTFNAVDPGDARPGAGTCVNFYAGMGLIAARSGDRPGDRYLLGDHAKPYFLAADHPPDGVDRDFARIFDFSPAGSRIVLHGSPDDYAFAVVEKPEKGTAIFYRDRGRFDLICFVADATLRDPRNDVFEYVSAKNAPPTTPVLGSGLQWGGPNADLILKVALGPDDDVFVTGVSRSAVPASEPSAQGVGDLFVARYGPDGALRWRTRFGSKTHKADLVMDLAVDADHVYAAGRYLSFRPFGLKDAFTVKLNATDGALLQESVWDGPHVQFAGALALDDRDFVYVSGIGYIEGQGVSRGAGPQDGVSEHTPQNPYLEKRSRSDLSVVKRVGFGAGSNKEPWGGLAFRAKPGGAAGQGVVYSSGWTMGNFAGAGPASQTGGDVWLACFNQDLEMLWVEQWGSSKRDWAWDLAVDSKGFVYVVGQTQGEMAGAGSAKGRGDGFISKFDPNGRQGRRLLWTRQIGTSDSDEIRSLAIVNDTIYVSGHTYGSLKGTNAGESDCWVAQLDLNGAVQRMIQFGTVGDERAFIAASSKSIAVGGFTSGSLCGANAGYFDTFLLRLDGNLGREALGRTEPWNSSRKPLR